MRKFALVLALVCVAVSAQAATIIFSDGFNFTGPLPGPPYFTTVLNGGTIGPWTVGGNSVDWIGEYWVPAEGNGSVDVSGMAAGSLSTTLSTVAGQSYMLSFYLAGNPGSGNLIKSLQVQVGDLDQVFNFDTTGRSYGSMGWVLASASFTSVAGNDTLTFTSLDQDAYGPALDGVTVSAVPEPATYAFALLGLAGIGLFRRRR
jgi:choice-of-anchor C domain-containing protein